MKPKTLTALAVAMSVGGVSPLTAQFDSGSTGANGALDVIVDTTLDLPADGIFHFTTINVASGRTLRFNRNSLNTPVALLAQGSVTVTGTIFLDGSDRNGPLPGEGGPGGFDGGHGGFGQSLNGTGGDGQGPGGGRNSSGAHHAAYAEVANNNTNRYGNALISPLIGGSGGAGSDGNPGTGGGGGGGGILIAGNTSITVNGTIRCRSGSGAGRGSGGSIRLIAPRVGGGGTLDVRGFGGSDGRIRIDTEDRNAYRSLSTFGSFTRGAQMFVFPPTTPRLDLIEVAGQAIPEGTPMPVEIELPIGSPTAPTVVVQGRDFTNNIVPITIAVIPENRPSIRYNTQIDMSTGNPATVTQDVTIPEGTITRVLTWTR